MNNDQDNQAILLTRGAFSALSYQTQSELIMTALRQGGLEPANLMRLWQLEQDGSRAPGTPSAPEHIDPKLRLELQALLNAAQYRYVLERRAGS